MAQYEYDKMHPLCNTQSGCIFCVSGAIAAQNICLAAQELGLGAVWLGTWPQMDRVVAQQKLFGLPDTIVPYSIIALCYPEADLTAPRKSRYEDDRVHFNQW